MAKKIYVLAERLNNSAPIFQRVNKDQKVPVVKRPNWAPFLQITCQDEKGITHNLRYKEGCGSMDQDDQIKNFNIPANAKFTNAERDNRQFRNGICITDKLYLQNYLEAYPGFEGSPYKSDEVEHGQYLLYDKTGEQKITNEETRKRIKAANKIFELELADAQAMLIRINGSFFETPNDVNECQNMLIEYLDSTDMKGVEQVIKEDNEMTVDEQTTILIGKLINAGLLSFDNAEGKISKKGKDGAWIDVRDMSVEYAPEERKRLFSDFLNSSEGKALKQDLTKDLAAYEKEAKKKE